jgi:hypothetical protein
VLNGSDVSRSLIAFLKAVDAGSAAWGTRVYAKDINLKGKTTPYLVVGVEDAQTDLLQVPDSRRMLTFQVYIGCVFGQGTTKATFWGRDTMSGAVRDALIASKLAISNYTTDPDNPVLVDTRDIENITISETIYESIADDYGLHSREMIGFIKIYQSKT